MRLHSSTFATLLAGIACSALLSGCSANFAPPSTATTSLATITGNVHGGRQPVAGAHVYVFSASLAGYGAASDSLLTPISTGDFPTTADTDGHYYVTTDANGRFALTGEYTCTLNHQVYLYAVGGNPGLPPGQTNSAAGFLAILGNCPAAGTLAQQVPHILVNEVSTVAAAYAFAAFAADATHVGSSGGTFINRAIANAFAGAANLYDVSGSQSGFARTAPATSAGISPQKEIHALANSLAACVNSTGPTSIQCSNLFTNIKSNGATGTTATDTATLAIYIAHNPTTAIDTIYNNPAGIGTPFLPTLDNRPNDFTVEVQFYSGTLAFPTYLAIDATGNVWVSCYSTSISKYSPTGELLSGLNGYSGGGLFNSSYIAIDAQGNAWVANRTGGTVSEFSPEGVPANSTGFKGNNDLDPTGIAVDDQDHIWVSNHSKNTISELTPTGVELPGSPYSAPGLNNPWGIAIDATGNLWSGNYNAADIVELTNAGVPIIGSPFNTGSYSTPRAIAMGANGGAWVANYDALSITKVTSAGVGTSITGGGINNPSDITVDGLGNVWTANHGNNSISEFSSAGVAISPSTGYKSPDLNIPYGIAVDGSGNIWVTNASGDTLSEFIGIAAPTFTPAVTNVSFNSFGTRP